MSVSQFIPSQLPNFIQEQYPQFVEFLKNYYKFLESNDDSPLARSERMLSDINIDSTADSNLEHFINYLGQYIPVTVTNKRLLLQHIKEFYLSRGTLESLRFFMSLILGFEDGKKTDINYPIDRTLHTSSGKWVKRKSLKIRFVDNVDINNFIDKFIVGSNNVSAQIESAFSYLIGGTKIIELFLLDGSIIGGTFVFGPAVIDAIYDVEILPVISGITVTNPGSGYNRNDTVILNPGSTGAGAVLSIGDIVGGKIFVIDVIQSGIGYNTAFSPSPSRSPSVSPSISPSISKSRSASISPSSSGSPSSSTSLSLSGSASLSPSSSLSFSPSPSRSPSSSVSPSSSISPSASLSPSSSISVSFSGSDSPSASISPSLSPSASNSSSASASISSSSSASISPSASVSPSASISLSPSASNSPSSSSSGSSSASISPSSSGSPSSSTSNSPSASLSPSASVSPSSSVSRSPSASLSLSVSPSISRSVSPSSSPSASSSRSLSPSSSPSSSVSPSISPSE